MSETVIARVQALAGPWGVDLTPMAAALPLLAGPMQQNGAAVALRHDRARFSVRVALREPDQRAVAPQLVEALAARAGGIRSLAARARVLAAGSAPIAVEVDTTVPPSAAGLALHTPGVAPEVVLDELAMPADERGRAAAILELLERRRADSVIWRFRPPVLTTATLVFAGPGGGDALAWAASNLRALAAVSGIARGNAVLDQMLDAGLPGGAPLVTLTLSADGLLPRLGLELDDVTLREAGAVLARFPDGKQSIVAASEAPVLGAEKTGTLSLVFADTSFGSLVVAVLPR